MTVTVIKTIVVNQSWLWNRLHCVITVILCTEHISSLCIEALLTIRFGQDPI